MLSNFAEKKETFFDLTKMNFLNSSKTHFFTFGQRNLFDYKKQNFSKFNKTHFFKEVNPCFWSKNAVFLIYSDLVKIRVEIMLKLH